MLKLIFGLRARCVALSAVLMVFGLLAACGGKVPPTNYYMLDLPAPEARPPDPLPYTAVVMPFRASPMLAQDRIVYRESPSQVGFYEYHRWAESPRTTILRLFLGQLRAKGAFDRVVPFEGRSNVDYVVRGTIEQLEEIDYGGSVRAQVRISAQLVDAKTNRPVWTDTAEATGPVTAGDVKVVVEQLGSAVQTSVSRLVDGINTYIRSSAVRSETSSAPSAPAGQK